MAVISPSWGGPSVHLRVFDLGLRNLEAILGVRVREFPTARMTSEALYENPKARAEDVNAAFADPGIKAIFASIGGDDSVRILPYLDLPTILANPKVLMGYSDTTTLTSWLVQHGLVTFNGPLRAGGLRAGRLPLGRGRVRVPRARGEGTRPRAGALRRPARPPGAPGLRDGVRGDRPT